MDRIDRILKDQRLMKYQIMKDQKMLNIIHKYKDILYQANERPQTEMLQAIIS
jgi:hypothetical protein